MALFEQTYCIDYNGWISGASTLPPPKQVDFASQTIPELIYTRANSDRVGMVFDTEKVSYTFSKFTSEMEILAAGLLSIGLAPGDRILICGSNHSQVMLSAFAASRAGLVFSLANPNFHEEEALHRALKLGNFRAIICFRALEAQDHLYSLLVRICPEIIGSHKVTPEGSGELKSVTLPNLTHIILAEEEHRHGGCYTLSEVFGRSSKEKIEKLPNYQNWSSHKLACLQFTLGTTAEPKLVAISHFQLLNGARAVVTSFGIKKDQTIACALPMFRLPIFALVCLSPFLTDSRTVFPEPQPLPKNLFASIKKYKCSTLLTNGAALRLLLKISETQRVKLDSIEQILLLGDRVSKEVLRSIQNQADNVKIIAVGYMLTETGSIPIMGDATTDFTRMIGRAIAGYETHLVPLDGKGDVKTGELGILQIRVYYGSTFMGYAPDINGKEKWVDTGDVARMDSEGSIEIVANKEDLIYDNNNGIVEHWNIERLLNQNSLIKGVQVVSVGRGKPVTAVCVLRNPQSNISYVRSELVEMCRTHMVISLIKIQIIDK
ncbi:AMP-binding enzyme [Dictyocaulus viviparus]|uniref:AMP-binding enzyme n=1 Tax=Dictyocaulus viviparus TaxID=29172 RepID=A0A0D8XIJ2_DICVI|nr:AMP-binding enzyme [Dictyocaulus viviparus]